ncbi:uncharacterized protein LOC120163145 [Hibiscus syriacus]|uniref:uncharacterized protein LOC120163145 n=1 Tax=Hibiscus syriacus TaxID=106335 RepID=UPI001921ECAA|nr:uncharacterized protein LOC120163145 [Hibiscus syriacus]
MDCDNTSLLKAPLSCKDMVTGMTHSPSQNQSDEELIDIEDDDFDLLEDDIRIGERDEIPFIDFSDRAQYLAIKSMDFTLVVKVLGCRVGYNTLHNRIYNIWKPSHPIKLIDIENDYFLVKFSCKQDYLKVQSDGPWTIFGHYLTVEPWFIEFCPTQSHPSRIMVWVRLPGLPITCYKWSMIEAIGNRIGSVVKVDYQTDNGRRGRFAHMAVNINLRKPLVSKININGRTQIVEYEALSTVCFECGIYGHVKDICSTLVAPVTENNVHSETLHSSTSKQDVVTKSSPVPNEAFGPWMMVKNVNGVPKRNL